MDISQTLEPNSDQLDSVELLGGPRIFEIEKVTKGNAEQPINIGLVGFPRPWRPGKSMRRVLAACWGTDASQWVGRRVELFCDPDVQFGGKSVGGTRVSRLSHIDAAKKIPLLVTRGKTATFVVQPLPDAPAAAPEPTAEEVAACTSRDQLVAWWEHSSPERQQQIRARVADLDNEPGVE